MPILLPLLLSWMIINGDPVERLDGSVIKEAALTDSIQVLMDSAGVTGLAVSVLNGNEVVYQKAFGCANSSSQDSLETTMVYSGASFSKAVFGYLMVQLAEEGIIDLDKPLQEYLNKPLPEYEFEKGWRGYAALRGDERYKKITARMCLSHTTGFPNWRWLTKAFDYDRSGDIRFLLEPGTRFSYSGEGIYLLQFVIEQITGKGLEMLAQEYVFQPLGMKYTSYLWQDRFEKVFCYGHNQAGEVLKKDRRDEADAAGSIQTTIEDYSRFISHMLKSCDRNTAVIQRLFMPNVRITSKLQFGYQSWQDTDAYDDIRLSYGLGWGLFHTPYGKAAFKEGHDAGFQHYSIIFPGRDIGMIIMSNSDNAESIFKYLLHIALRDTYTPWRWERYIPYDQNK